MTTKNLPYWHPIRIIQRNPSLDDDNTLWFEFFRRSDVEPRPSFFQEVQYLLRQMLGRVTQVCERRNSGV